jgi:hypothetical protein
MVREFSMQGRFSAPGADEFLLPDRYPDLALTVVGLHFSFTIYAPEVCRRCFTGQVVRRNTAVTAGYPFFHFFFVNHGSFQLLTSRDLFLNDIHTGKKFSITDIILNRAGEYIPLTGCCKICIEPTLPFMITKKRIVQPVHLTPLSLPARQHNQARPPHALTLRSIFSLR